MRRPLPFLLAVAAATLPWPGAATADAPAPSTSPSGSAAATASASAGEAEAPVELANLATIDLPTEASPVPTTDEWKEARAIALSSPLPPPCRAHLQREWLRVRCSGFLPGAGTVVSGPSEGVAFFAGVPPVPSIPQYFPDADRGWIEVVMPLRRGVSRLVQMTRMGDGGGYGWFGQSLMVLLSEQWPEGRERPEIFTNHREWQTEDVLGMKLGSVEEADALGLPSKWGGPIILSVEPGSPADEGGAKPGDNIAGLTSEAWQDDLAFGPGPIFELLVQRRGTAKQIALPRRR